MAAHDQLPAPQCYAPEGSGAACHEAVRFPWMPAILCLACVTMSTCLFAYYSWCARVTPDQLFVDSDHSHLVGRYVELTGVPVEKTTYRISPSVLYGIAGSSASLDSATLSVYRKLAWVHVGSPPRDPTTAPAWALPGEECATTISLSSARGQPLAPRVASYQGRVVLMPGYPRTPGGGVVPEIDAGRCPEHERLLAPAQGYSPAAEVGIPSRLEPLLSPTYSLIPVVDADRGRLCAETVAGLVVCLMGCFVFSLYLRHWWVSGLAAQQSRQVTTGMEQPREEAS
jgi:hypothetical protein